jgi:hypothetical protein
MQGVFKLSVAYEHSLTYEGNVYLNPKLAAENVLSQIFHKPPKNHKTILAFIVIRIKVNISWHVRSTPFPP